MQVAGDETCPLPDHPVLGSVATALNDGGYWAEILDPEWHSVYLTDDARRIYGGRVELAPYTIGAHFLGPERLEDAMQWRGGVFPLEIMRELLAAFGPWILADTPGGREQLRERVDPRLRDIVEGLSPTSPSSAWTFTFRGIYTARGAKVDIFNTLVRLRDDAGEVVGTALIAKPAVGMAV